MREVSIRSGLGSIALILFASQAAMAADEGFYVGLNVGEGKARIAQRDIFNRLVGQGFTATSFDRNSEDTGFKAFGGYQFSPHFALEGGYFDLGEYGFDAVMVPASTFSGDVEVRGINLDAVLKYPLTEKLSVLGRVGVTRAETEGSFRSSGAALVSTASTKERDTNVKYGVGLQYDFTNAFAMRVELERYRIDDSVGSRGDIDLASLGLVYHFGQDAPAPAPVAQTPAPTPRAAAPAPAPVAPVPPAPMRVTLSADSMFDFDSSTIRPAGRTELDALVRDLRGVDYDVVRVTGHTDRLGSASYNQDLSVRRANAVRDYLISAGIPASKVTARGAGESEPITPVGQCSGTTRTPELIACLQPERRVEVEVTGTR